MGEGKSGLSPGSARGRPGAGRSVQRGGTGIFGSSSDGTHPGASVAGLAQTRVRGGGRPRPEGLRQGVGVRDSGWKLRAGRHRDAGRGRRGGGGSTHSAVPDAEAGRGQHCEESPLRVGLDVDRRLGRASHRAEQPLGPAAQEIHGPRGAADAAAPGGPQPRPSQSAARGRTPASRTVAGSSGHLLAGRGQATAMPSYEGTSELTGPRVGEGESGLRGEEERGGPPWPRPVLGPRGRQHPAPRGKAPARAH